MQKRSLTILFLFFIFANAAPGQPGPDAQPFKITDKAPVIAKPEYEKSTDGTAYFRFYHNQNGDLLKEEKYDLNKNHLETRYVEEIYSKGYPAKEVVLTGPKDRVSGEIKVSGMTEIFRDPQGGITKTEIYSGFGPDGVATKKVVDTNGVKADFRYDKASAKWIPVEEKVEPPRKRKAVAPPPLALAVDRCVVGSWRALPTPNGGGIGEGMIFRTGGLSLNIDADGSTVFDFGTIPAYTYSNADELFELKATGKRSARIKTVREGKATSMQTTTVPSLNVAVRLSSNKGFQSEERSTFFFPMATSYGVGVGESTAYTCSGDTLVIANALAFARSTQ